MEILITGSFQQLVLTDVWKLLSYSDLVNLCKSSKTFLPLLADHKIWYHLLDRDHPRWQLARDVFEDPKEYYEVCHWIGITFFPTFPFSSDGYPDHANAFITHKCKQIITSQPKEPVTALLFLNGSIDSFKTLITGENIYDLIFQAITIISSQSLIELFEDYYEFNVVLFKQILDYIITRWVKPNYEDSLPHLVIVS